MQLNSFHIVSKFSRPVLAIALAIGLSACTPLPNGNITNVPNNKNDQQKLSAEQVEEFGRVLTSIGRIEELARVMKSRGETWGTSDAILAELQSAFGGTDCDAQFSEGTSTRRGFKARTVEFVGSQCPIVFSLRFDFQIITDPARQIGQLHLTGSFVLNDALAARNGIKKFEITNWSGTFRDTTRMSIKHLETSFIGNAKATTADDKVYLLNVHGKSIIEQRPNGLYTASSGFIKLTNPERVRVELVSKGDGTFTLNGGQRIDKQAFLDYVSTLGIVGDAFKAYSNF